jgi:hypothetical protein
LLCSGSVQPASTATASTSCSPSLPRGVSCLRARYGSQSGFYFPMPEVSCCYSPPSLYLHHHRPITGDTHWNSDVHAPSARLPHCRRACPTSPWLEHAGLNHGLLQTVAFLGQGAGCIRTHRASRQTVHSVTTRCSEEHGLGFTRASHSCDVMLALILACKVPSKRYQCLGAPDTYCRGNSAQRLRCIKQYLEGRTALCNTNVNEACPA